MARIWLFFWLFIGSTPALAQSFSEKTLEDVAAIGIENLRRSDEAYVASFDGSTGTWLLKGETQDARFFVSDAMELDSHERASKPRWALVVSFTDSETKPGQVEVRKHGETEWTRQDNLELRFKNHKHLMFSSWSIGQVRKKIDRDFGLSGEAVQLAVRDALLDKLPSFIEALENQDPRLTAGSHGLDQSTKIYPLLGADWEIPHFDVTYRENEALEMRYLLVYAKPHRARDVWHPLMHRDASWLDGIEGYKSTTGGVAPTARVLYRKNAGDDISIAALVDFQNAGNQRGFTISVASGKPFVVAVEALLDQIVAGEDLETLRHVPFPGAGKPADEERDGVLRFYAAEGGAQSQTLMEWAVKTPGSYKVVRKAILPNPLNAKRRELLMLVERDGRHALMLFSGLSDGDNGATVEFRGGALAELEEAFSLREEAVRVREQEGDEAWERFKQVAKEGKIRDRKIWEAFDKSISTFLSKEGMRVIEKGDHRVFSIRAPIERNYDQDALADIHQITVIEARRKGDVQGLKPVRIELAGRVVGSPEWQSWDNGDRISNEAFDGAVLSLKTDNLEELRLRIENFRQGIFYIVAVPPDVDPPDFATTP